MNDALDLQEIQANPKSPQMGPPICTWGRVGSMSCSRMTPDGRWVMKKAITDERRGGKT